MPSWWAVPDAPAPSITRCRRECVRGTLQPAPPTPAWWTPCPPTADTTPPPARSPRGATAVPTACLPPSSSTGRTAGTSPSPAARLTRAAVRTRSSGRAGCGEQLLACGELDPRTVLSRSNRLLVGVDRPPPVRGRDRTRLAFGEQRVKACRVIGRTRGQRSCAQVLDETVDRLLGVALVRPEDPGRASLDPAHGINPGQRP